MFNWKSVFYKLLGRKENSPLDENTSLSFLRPKWHEVPIGMGRLSTRDLLEIKDVELINLWQRTRIQETQNDGFTIRGWYHLLYKDILRGKKVLDIGSGFGIDGITFAEHGAKITFVDIVETNLFIIKRLCKLCKVEDVSFLYLDSLNAFSTLPNDYDVVWCQGSMINAPFNFIKQEAKEILKHLKHGGRWIELAYPKSRWEKEGSLPFDKWGEFTDGVGTPWVEWYDLEKLRKRLAPAKFDVVLNFEFHNHDFIWFDLIRRC